MQISFFFSWKDFITSAVFLSMRSSKLRIHFPVVYLITIPEITSGFALICITAVNSKYCINCIGRHCMQLCAFQSFYNYSISFHSHFKKIKSFITRSFGCFSLKWQRKFRWIITNQEKLWLQHIFIKFCRTIQAKVTGI